MKMVRDAKLRLVFDDAAKHENLIAPLKGRCEKNGRARLLPSHRPSKSVRREVRREPRPPDLGRF